MRMLRSLLFMFLLFALPMQVFAQKLIPMGNSVTIELLTEHLIVTGDVLLEQDEWLRKGDKIMQVNNQQVTSKHELFTLEAPHYTVTLERDGRTKRIQVNADKWIQLQSFIKEKTDGIGTLTYVNPQTKEFGALGHQIVDQTLQQPPDIKSGTLYLSAVSNIVKSVKGQPGYKISDPMISEVKAGSIEANALYGIFGKWQLPSQQSMFGPMEIIHAKRIHTGAAKLVTQIEGQRIEQFDIMITEVSDETFQFEVTDKRLLQKTGGIVQGMSGSPIIQGDYFIGAVTHMFVEQPTKGAALSIVEMIRKSDK